MQLACISSMILLYLQRVTKDIYLGFRDVAPSWGTDRERSRAIVELGATRDIIPRAADSSGLGLQVAVKAIIVLVSGLLSGSPPSWPLAHRRTCFDYHQQGPGIPFLLLRLGTWDLLAPRRPLTCLPLTPRLIHRSATLNARYTPLQRLHTFQRTTFRIPGDESRNK